MIKYRPEIDGLRGFAVLVVVLFHAGLPGVPGGFVGVDMFFVISGFLITSIIAADLAQGRFSFANFYERRARRILPALYAMAALSFGVALVVQTPVQLMKSAKSMLAAIGFSSNIYFWRTTNYFSDASDFEPFLHTWSLGVEEQFYFLFPLVLLALHSRKRWLVGVTVGALGLSLGLSAYGTEHHAWAAYYLLPSRAWQMMTGALLALARPRLPQSKALRHGLAVLALLCLVLPVLSYSKQTPFPGVAAIPPTLGAALLIYLGDGSKSWITRLFRIRPLVWLGLVSYSLYLWHWPIFAFTRSYLATVELSPPVAGLAAIASVVAAWGSWRWVEAPFRDRQAFGRRRIFSLAAAGSAALIAGLSLTVFLDGLPGRLDPRVIRFAHLSGQAILDDQCIHREPEEVDEGDVCLLNGDGNPTVALWGDSHAAAFKPGFTHYLQDGQDTGAFIGRVGCPPLPGLLKLQDDDGEACRRLNGAVLRYLLSTPSIETVVLHARWALSVEGSRFGEEKGKGYVVRDESSGLSSSDNADHVASALSRLLEQLESAGKAVVLLGPVPEVGRNVPRAVANNIQWSKTREIRVSAQAVSVRQSRSVSLLRKAASAHASTTYVPSEQAFCGKRMCGIQQDDALWYVDDDHLSADGAVLLASLLPRGK